MKEPIIKAIILAAGKGDRFENETPKQFVKLAGLPLITHTLKIFNNYPDIKEIIIVTLKEYIEKTWELVSLYGLNKVTKIVLGGATRQESSKIGIDCCGADTDFLLIHDSVRPFLSNFALKKMIEAVKKYKAVDMVIPSADTIVEVDKRNFIVNIPDRAKHRRGQTPQAFEYSLIKKAHEKAIKDNLSNFTDDCSLVLRLGHKVYTVNGEEQNIKITYPLDFHIADKLFQIKTVLPPAFNNDEYEKLKGKVFIILGGTSGIGLELSKKLKNFSKKVYPLSRKSVPSVDVTDFNSLNNIFREIWRKEKRIDYLINSAGVLLRRDVEFMSEAEWDFIYNTNIKGCFNVAKAIIPFLKEQHKGSIVFLGSSSYTRGRAGYSAYSSSKAALVNFSQALAEELSDFNIKVNVVSPSRVKTPLRYKNFGKEDPSTLLKPDRVADVIIKVLVSDITGSVFDII